MSVLGGKQKSMSLAVLDGVQTLSTPMFFRPTRLNELLSASTQYPLNEGLHRDSERSMAGQCVFEWLSVSLAASLSRTLNGVQWRPA